VTVAERLAQHVLATRYEALPALPVAATKTFLLDALSVGIAGSGDPLSRRVRAAARQWGEAPEATVLGTDLRLPAPAAALINAQQMHCQEFDCVHEEAVVHAMSVVTPAALAWAERADGVTGRDFLTALALGVDVAVTLGLNPSGAWRFFRPATAGAFGAVAALGYLARLDPTALIDAFGIMLGQVSGTMQPHTEGRGLLPLQMGFNARNAVMTLDLAQAGIEGTRETFEGERGYFALFEGGSDAGAALAELGHRFRIAELSHKPYPSGRATHGLIDGLLRLRDQNRFSADEVERIVLLGSPLIAQLVARPLVPGMSVSYARLCARFVGAIALRRGTVRLDDFSPANLTDPATLELAARIDIGIDQSIAGRVLLPQSLLVQLKSSAICRDTVTEVLGSPARPLSREQALKKFWACFEHSACALARDNGARVIELVDRLEMLESVVPLIRLCAA